MGKSNKKKKRELVEIPENFVGVWAREVVLSLSDVKGLKIDNNLLFKTFLKNYLLDQGFVV